MKPRPWRQVIRMIQLKEVAESIRLLTEQHHGRHHTVSKLSEGWLPELPCRFTITTPVDAEFPKGRTFKVTVEEVTQ